VQITREWERAWVWHASLPPLPVARKVRDVEAWATKYLRCSAVRVLTSATALVIADGVLPSVAWAAGWSDMPNDRREYAAMDGMLAFLQEVGGGDLQLQSPVRGDSRPCVATLRDCIRRGDHPALEQILPLLTELPVSTDAKGATLRSALLDLIGDENALTPKGWQESTMLDMVNDSQRRCVLFVLAMHSRCNLELHVDMLGTAVIYHAVHGSKLLLVWPPTPTNLERLGRSMLGEELDAIHPFEGGAAHILRAGEKLLIAPLAIHLVVNLTPALSVGINFNCASSVALLTHLNGALREEGWYKKLVSHQIGIGLEHRTPAHLGKKLRAFK